MSSQNVAGSTRTAPPEPSVALSAPNALRERLNGVEPFTQDEIDSGLARVALELPLEIERQPLDRMVRGLVS